MVKLRSSNFVFCFVPDAKPKTTYLCINCSTSIILVNVEDRISIFFSVLMILKLNIVISVHFNFVIPYRYLFKLQNTWISLLFNYVPLLYSPFVVNLIQNSKAQKDIQLSLPTTQFPQLIQVPLPRRNNIYQLFGFHFRNISLTSN